MTASWLAQQANNFDLDARGKFFDSGSDKDAEYDNPGGSQKMDREQPGSEWTPARYGRTLDRGCRHAGATCRGLTAGCCASCPHTSLVVWCRGQDAPRPDLSPCVLGFFENLMSGGKLQREYDKQMQQKRQK